MGLTSRYSKTFYTYLYLRYDGTPTYVGKGCGWRVFNSNGHHVKPPLDRNFIIIQAHASEEDAVFAEQFLIAYYGRKDLGTGCLRNRTNGGDGIAGISEELRKRKVAMMLGNKRGLGYRLTPEQLRARSLREYTPRHVLVSNFKGKHHSLAAKQHISESKKQNICQRGHVLSPDNLLISTRHDGKDGSVRIKRNCKICTNLRNERVAISRL